MEKAWPPTTLCSIFCIFFYFIHTTTLFSILLFLQHKHKLLVSKGLGFVPCSTYQSPAWCLAHRVLNKIIQRMNEAAPSIIPTLQLQKLTLRWWMSFTHPHSANQWQRGDLNTDHRNPRAASTWAGCITRQSLGGGT